MQAYTGWQCSLEITRDNETHGLPAHFASAALCLSAKRKGPTDLRGVLLQQIQTVHNQKHWFVPADEAVKGLTPEQAKWTDGKCNHSVGQLANHMAFWNMQDLAKFRGEKPPTFSGVNDETFNSFNSEQWAQTVGRLDESLTGWENAIKTADERKLAAWAATINHVGMHNAYHLGQILYVRKLQGAWNPENGVK